MSHQEQTERKSRSPKQFWLMALIGVFILLVIVVVVIPAVIRAEKMSPRATASNNAKQIGILMLEFDNDFGAYPSDQTAEKQDVLNDYVGEYSNDYLGQFIAGGYIDSEEIFYIEWASDNSKKPDNNCKTREETLATGECSFSYIKGLSGSDKSSTPVLLVPMSGDGYKFNTSVSMDRAVVLRIEGSVVSLRLNKAGQAKLPSGKTLFEGGADTVWGEEGFDAKYLLFPK